MKTHKARRHHPYSPSKLNYFEACPGFASMPGSSAAAERGTACHEASETGDFTGLTQEERAAVEACTDFVKLVKEEMPGCQDIQEIEVCVDDKNTTRGFLDRVLISADGKTARVIDYKFGFGIVESVKYNRQGQAYAIGVLRKFKGLETIVVTFLTPNQQIFEDTHVYSRADLEQAYLDIVSIVHRAKAAKSAARRSEFGTARPTLGTCRFCRYASGACTKAEELQRPLQVFVPVKAYTLEQMMTTTSPEDMAGALDYCKFIEGLLKQVKDRVAGAAQNGLEIPGYSLTSRATREVVNIAGLESFLLSTKAVTEEELLSCRSLSLTSLDAAIKRNLPKGDKLSGLRAHHDRWMDEGFIIKKPGATFLQRQESLEVPSLAYTPFAPSGDAAKQHHFSSMQSASGFMED